MNHAPIAVFFALDVESGYFADRLEEAEHLHAPEFDVISGTIAQTEFLVVNTGAGMAAARRVAETVCRSHQPRMIISAGFAGALDPRLPKHSLFIPSEVIRWTDSESGKNSESGKGFESGKTSDSGPEGNVSEECGSAAALKNICTIFNTLKPGDFPKELRGKMTFGGRLLTGNRVVASRAEKLRLGVKYGAGAVEMETYAAAELCGELNLPFLAVRVMSDASDEDLPNDVQKLVEQKTTFSRWGAALQMMVQRPSSIRDMYRLYEGSVESAVVLADFLEAFASLEQLKFLSENFYPPQKREKLLPKG